MEADPATYSHCETFRDVILLWAERHPKLDREHTQGTLARVPEDVLNVPATGRTIPTLLRGLQSASDAATLSPVVSKERLN